MIFSQQELVIDYLRGFYKSCKYGTVINGKKYTNDNFDECAIDKAKLLFPAEISKYKCGTCYDTVQYSIETFLKYNIHFRHCFISTRKQYDYEQGMWNDPTHTFILYYLNDKCYWLEGSWRKYIDINISRTDSDALVKYIKKIWCESNNTDKAYVRSIINYPKPGLTYHKAYKQFMSGKIIF